MSKLKQLLSDSDLEQIKSKGLEIKDLEKQYQKFLKGFPPAILIEASTLENSQIKPLKENNLNFYKDYYEKNKNNLEILKFVPASGAASRMFKALFNYVETNQEKTPKEIENLVKNINKFAFYEDLKEKFKQQSTSLDNEIEKRNYKKIIKTIISLPGLNYGKLPKGLIKFHKYDNFCRTPFEEHIVESINYASTDKGNNIHFTVSPEHIKGFEKLADEKIPEFEQKFNAKINIDFSVQDPATDTMAVNMNNEPFRLKDGSILFRPGGHGALIHNLNKIDADIIFIKNIDNVVPDKKKKIDTKYKKALSGVLLEAQKRIFDFIELLLHSPSKETIDEAFNYIKNSLSIKLFFDENKLNINEKIEFLVNILNRPLRVCGMVKNEGEPGGGPFLVKQNNYFASLQIIEKAQINTDDKESKKILDNSTHFNPTDLVISKKKHNGNNFNLLDYVDDQTGFISKKSKNGKDLKALELPGLWNGAMAHWNTIFVEMPLETFNPVKTIFDLLREAHQ